MRWRETVVDQYTTYVIFKLIFSYSLLLSWVSFLPHYLLKPLWQPPNSPSYHYFLAPQGKSFLLWRNSPFPFVSLYRCSGSPSCISHMLPWMQKTGFWIWYPSHLSGHLGCVQVSVHVCLCVCVQGWGLLKKAQYKANYKVVNEKTETVGDLETWRLHITGLSSYHTWDPTQQ